MTIDEARELFEFGSWATARMFNAAESLTQNQRETTVSSSFPSVNATLAHIVGAEWVWLSRWSGKNPSTYPDWVLKPELTELRQILKGVEDDRSSYLIQLRDPDLNQNVSYRGFDGQEYTLPLGKLMRHVVNHSTYHRGQLATQLRQLGIVPPSTDFSRYLRENR